MDVIDHTVIGGGIVGLFVAKALKEKFPDQDVVLLEASPFLGDQNTGRNSGVIHSGIYYPTNSFKHKLCLEGNRIWREKASEYHADINLCGKYIVSCSAEETQKLQEIFDNGLRNEVPGLRWGDKEDLKVLSPFVNVDQCLFSPHTAIIDVPKVVKYLDRTLTHLDCIILKDNPVTDLKKEEHFVIKTLRESFYSRRVFNCAGLGAIHLREKLNLKDFQNYFVKGNYVKTHQEYFSQNLIYPLPDKNNLGLGIHTVLDPLGGVLFGPNTEVIEEINYEISEDTVDEMYREIPRVFKKIDPEKLSPAYCGIRTKIKKEGEVVNDFLIQGPLQTGIENYYECLGIDSPGLTSSPAIAKYVISLMTE